ncbi:Glucose-6-phosphate 1-dehydrogenase [Allomyces javanicus]|nr:Glucose-6-phosphate 1-dehydrogenase [Allomyces javanicus]
MTTDAHQATPPLPARPRRKSRLWSAWQRLWAVPPSSPPHGSRTHAPASDPHAASNSAAAAAPSSHPSSSATDDSSTDSQWTPLVFAPPIASTQHTDLVSTLLALRFANPLLARVWDRTCIAAIHVSATSPTPARTTLESRLVPLLAVLAMDTPVTLRSDDVRSECAKALRGAVVDDAVGDADACACVVRIDNDRWAGVPLVLEAHTGDDVVTEIRVQLAAVAGAHRLFAEPPPRNELVVRVVGQGGYPVVHVALTAGGPACHCDLPAAAGADADAEKVVCGDVKLGDAARKLIGAVLQQQVDEGVAKGEDAVRALLVRHGVVDTRTDA